MFNVQSSMQIQINSLEEITSAAKTFLTLLRQPLPSLTGGVGGGSSSIIAFYGSMGAGKTTFIRAICEELGVREPVTSPTFAIVNEYVINDDFRMMNDEYKEQASILNPQSSIINHQSSFINHQSSILNPQSSVINHQSSINKIFHFDFYRIKRLEEAYDMGFEDYLYSGHLCLIEWPELIEELLPDTTVRVHITANEDGSRTISW